MQNHRYTVGIFGGTGFVGSHLGPALYRAGYALRIFSRGMHLPNPLAVLPDTTLFRLDQFEVEPLTRALDGCDACINLIGILNERGRSGRGFHRVHVAFTENILAACEKAGVPRYLHMSSLRAGEGTSHYLRSRGEAEQRVQAAAGATTVFQPSVIFGRGDGLLTRFAGLLGIMPVLPLARPNARFAPVYVGDVARAFVAACNDSDTVGKTYPLCGPRVYTLREIVDYVCEVRGWRRLIVGLPDWIARAQAGVMDFVPGKPFSTDNYRSLLVDSVSERNGLAEMGIQPTPMEAIAPGVLGLPADERRLAHARRSHSFIDRAGE